MVINLLFDYYILRMKPIKSAEQVISYFKENDCPLFYIGTIYGTAMLNIYPFIPKFQIITCSDPYFGAFPFIKIPQFIKNGNHLCAMSHQICAVTMLSNPEVITYMKSKGVSPKIIFKIPNSQLQKLCAQNGFQIWGASLEMFQFLGNKVDVLNILNKVQVPYIPSICSNINNYEHFKEIISNFSSESVVVQNQIGSGGLGTMFISNEDQYITYQKILQNGKVFKIMKHRNLKCFAIVGVATKKGVIFGPLVSELIGHENLTPHLGGYCGNQLRVSYFQDQQVEMKIRREIYRHTEKFINHIYNEGLFKGSFGCDFSVDMDTNEVFFMEINPRLTGSTSLSFQFYEAQGNRFPLLLYHCLEFLKIDIQIDINALNKQWIQLQHYQEEYSYVLIKAFSQSEVSIPYTFPAGIWKIENGVPKNIDKIDFRMRNLKQDEVLFTPIKGVNKVAIGFKGRIQDYNFKLTQKHKRIINQIISQRLKHKILEK